MTVSFREVTIRYGECVAVDRASAEFPAGTVGLLGRNGAGKTSILRALLGLVRPVSGEVQFGELAAGASPLEVRRHVGYMPEKDCHVPGLNGFETVCLMARLTGLPPREAARRAHEVLYLAELGDERYRSVSGYSTGMRQKVKLASALVHDPSVLFLDEPTNGLDPDGRREMLELIEALAGELGKSIVLSSHILQDVERVCRDVVLMEAGRIVARGDLASLTRSETRTFEFECAGLAAPEVDDALRRAGVLAIEPRSDGSSRLTFPEGLPTRAVFAAVQQSGGSVRRLVERHRTLEEVFLGIVGAGGPS